VVEEARLESVYTGDGIEGSNPSLSANNAKVLSISGPEKDPDLYPEVGIISIKA
jgi:hypothetical protein